METNEGGTMQRLTKKPAGNFLGHFKASRCSQSSASSYHPTAEVAALTSATAQSPLLATCRNHGPDAWARVPSHCTTAALAEKNWHGGTGGIFKSAQQPSAHVDQHIFIFTSTGQGQLEEQKLSRGAGKGNYLLGFPARLSRRLVR